MRKDMTSYPFLMAMYCFGLILFCISDLKPEAFYLGCAFCIGSASNIALQKLRPNH